MAYNSEDVIPVNRKWCNIVIKVIWMMIEKNYIFLFQLDALVVGEGEVVDVDVAEEGVDDKIPLFLTCISKRQFKPHSFVSAMETNKDWLIEGITFQIKRYVYQNYSRDHWT